MIELFTLTQSIQLIVYPTIVTYEVIKGLGYNSVMRAYFITLMQLGSLCMPLPTVAYMRLA